MASLKDKPRAKVLGAAYYAESILDHAREQFRRERDFKAASAKIVALGFGVTAAHKRAASAEVAPIRERAMVACSSSKHYGACTHQEVLAALLVLLGE